MHSAGLSSTDTQHSLSPFALITTSRLWRCSECLWDFTIFWSEFAVHSDENISLIYANVCDSYLSDEQGIGAKDDTVPPWVWVAWMLIAPLLVAMSGQYGTYIGVGIIHDFVSLQLTSRVS